MGTNRWHIDTKGFSSAVKTLLPFLGGMVALHLVVSRLFGKPLSLTGAFGEGLSCLLTLLWWGHVGLYRPRTYRQRLVSWTYLFVVQFAQTGIRDVVKHRPTDVSNIIFSAVLASLAVGGVWLYQRRQAHKMSVPK